MVHVDGFRVALVRAENNEAFKEHTAPGGNVYAEVEPGVEYFIRVSTPRSAQVRVRVDGEKLGYHLNWTKPGSDNLGNRDRKDGISTTTALRFSAVRGVKSEGMLSNNLTGKVEVTFHALGEKSYKEVRDYDSKVLSGDSALGGKKCVTSISGSTVLKTKQKTHEGARKLSFKKGDHLCTITIHYCTAAGLLVNKILDAPPSAAGDVKSSMDGGKVKPESTTNAKKRSRESVSTEESSSTTKPCRRDNASETRGKLLEELEGERKQRQELERKLAEASQREEELKRKLGDSEKKPKAAEAEAIDLTGDDDEGLI